MDRELSAKRGALGALFSSLFYALSGIFEKEASSVKESLTPSQVRTKTLFDSFLTLVSEYHTSERGMAFYASRLGLTPKYLSRLVKQYSGRSAPDWIDSFVILEAKNLLRYSGYSIKEIVFKLNFLNPSVFYKYFKAHTGMTPSEYRNADFA
ncbi:MAG: AraC family transcriptional regulator [Bacteroidales bacterium]|nr:AraC family transcriptional regulator [Bacteroidales bacterium]